MTDRQTDRRTDRRTDRILIAIPRLHAARYKRHNRAGRWCMLLLFVGTSDLEQIGLELSLENMQCHLLSQTRKTVPQRPSVDSQAAPPVV